MSNKNKVLITGGAGFIGSHLAAKLLADGYQVVVIDNLLTGSLSNLQEFFDLPNFKFIEHDVREPLPELEADFVFHLASPASPLQYQRNPINTLMTNVVGSYHVLELARKNKSRVLLASTSEVYGDPEISPQPESYWGKVNPIGERSCYDEGKRAAEALFFDYYRKEGVDIRVARIFNTFGPKMRKDDGRVVTNFIIQALTNRPLTIFGDGSQTRSFMYIDDLIQGLQALMYNNKVIGPVNLGNPQEVTIKELAEKVIELANSNSIIEFRPLPADDPKRRLPDISLAQTEIGFNPQVDLETGLKATISYWRQLLKV